MQALLSRYPIISKQITRPALAVVLDELEKVIGAEVTGDIAEFGCYIGTTSLFIRRLMDVLGASQSRQFYAYDSFVGLPDKTKPDSSSAGEQFKAGELAVSKKQFLQEFQRAHLTPPRTVKAWFADLTSDQLPQQLAFAFLDGDFYESIRDSLELVWPRLQAGGVICIDDYQREALPGVERAVARFIGQHPGLSVRQVQHIGIIRKS